MKLSRPVLEWLIFGGVGERRYTQGSPVLPDVWIAYGLEPGRPQELLLTPHRDSRPGAVAVALRRRLGVDGDGRGERGHGVAYTQSTVAARLTLAELVEAVLPMTGWWQDMLKAVPDAGEGALETLRRRLPAELRPLDERGGPQDRRWWLPDERPAPPDPGAAGEPAGAATGPPPPLPSDLVWMARIVGWLAWAEGSDAEPPSDAAAFRRWRDGGDGPGPAELAGLVVSLVGRATARPPSDEADEARVYLVNRNRSATLAVRDSRLAVKADAAWLLFSVSCRDIAWAVIDSGIDATHPAFRAIDTKTGQPFPEPFRRDGERVLNQTRVVRTFDFTRVRLLLNPAIVAPLAADRGGENPALQMAISGLVGGESAWPGREEWERQKSVTGRKVEDLRNLLAAGDGRLRGQLADLLKRLEAGADIDWALLEPFLEIHPSEYWLPSSDHGTHVAGILAADWRDERMTGLCPDLALYDLRVLPTGLPGPDDELNVMAALQFLRHLNRQKDHFVVHGANLSLSIPHEVANYACGRTPVCEEAARVAASGMVVVAAAGNNGYLRYQTAEGEREGYHTISITDPGNAEDVITVGATHRNRPHTYGVSYFSSRGPTGDGRRKPDLVAPGEKIEAPVPGEASAEKDGTSMAAPHVSGAAAILLARHRELIGQPARVKHILCSSATDLGREAYFQGCGMLDVLRALQSV